MSTKFHFAEGSFTDVSADDVVADGARFLFCDVVLSLGRLAILQIRVVLGPSLWSHLHCL